LSDFTGHIEEDDKNKKPRVNKENQNKIYILPYSILELIYAIAVFINGLL